MVANVISDTTIFPWSAVVQIYSTFPSGRQYAGSGVIVGRNNVLTASHVVYDASEGGTAVAVGVYPGRIENLAPFGLYIATEITPYGLELDGNPNSMTAAETAYDIALLGFSEELGAETGGWMDAASFGPSGGANVTGYPSRTPDKVPDGTHAWNDFGTVTNNRDGTLTASGIFVAPGHSGGPAWVDGDPGPGISPLVVGILSAQGIGALNLDEGYLTYVGPDNPRSRAFLDRMGRDDALLSGQLFDAPYYLAANPDVRDASVDSRAHYMTLGWQEGRNPNPLFNTSGYLAAFADVRASGINPLEHYRLFGWREGRDPSTAFDTGSYLATYRDVAASGLNPLDHYLRFGQAEGRLTFGDGAWT